MPVVYGHPLLHASAVSDSFLKNKFAKHWWCQGLDLSSPVSRELTTTVLDGQNELKRGWLTLQNLPLSFYMMCRRGYGKVMWISGKYIKEQEFISHLKTWSMEILGFLQFEVKHKNAGCRPQPLYIYNEYRWLLTWKIIWLQVIKKK